MKSSQHLSSYQALKKLREKHPRHNGHYYFSYGQASMYLERVHNETSVVYIAGFQVTDTVRGKGHGKRAMRTVCSWADKYGITLTLIASRFDEGPLSTANLVKWYRTFGFKGTRYGMKRIPN